MSGAESNDNEWLPGRGGFAVAYMPDEKNFLRSVFNRYPDLRAAFRACEKIQPEMRPHTARVWLTEQKRRLWKDHGVPEQVQETLAEHSGQMARLACLHPQKNYDFDRTLKLISLWGVPLAIADEKPLEEMNWEDRHDLRRMAARMMFDHYTFRKDHEEWKNLNSLQTRDAKWVHDLDYMVTALKACHYQALYPALANSFDRVIDNSRRALLTKEAKEIWHDVVGMRLPIRLENLPPDVPASVRKNASAANFHNAPDMHV